MNTRRTQLLLTVALVSTAAFTTTPLMAQAVTNAMATPKPVELPELPPYRPWTVGVGAGTDGIIGAGLSWRFSDHLGARVGVGYTKVSDDALEIGGIHYDASLRLLLEPLMLDIYPWEKRSFRFSVGVLFNQNELSGTVSEAGTIIIGGQPITIPPGSLTMKVEQQPVNPYFSIGGNLFYFDHAHHWALAGELGVAYTGEAEVSVDRTGSSSLPDAAVSKVKNEIEDYASQYKWWPVVKLAVTFSF